MLLKDVKLNAQVGCGNTLLIIDSPSMVIKKLAMSDDKLKILNKEILNGIVDLVNRLVELTVSTYDDIVDTYREKPEIKANFISWYKANKNMSVRTYLNKLIDYANKADIAYKVYEEEHASTFVRNKRIELSKQINSIELSIASLYSYSKE